MLRFGEPVLLSVPAILIFLLIALVLIIIAAQWFILRAQSRSESANGVRAREFRRLEDTLFETQELVMQLQRNVQDLEKRLSTPVVTPEPVIATPQAPVPPASLPPDQPYNRVIELIQQGYGAEALVDTCGISRAEAELLVKLHRRQA